MRQTILITGASSGFGEACARKFALSGDVLILVARRTERLLQLQRELESSSPIHILTLDVTDTAAVEEALHALPAGFESVDVLINNAGLALGLGAAQNADPGDWNTMINTNITALVHMTRLILPGMVARNRGHIINIGSTAGNWPYPGGNVYGASKAFVKQFSRNLRADLIGRQIRVSNIEPGMAETEFSQVRFKQDKARADKVYEGVKPLSAEDIADIVHWVCKVPAHVNINSLEVMPICQAWGALAVDRTMDIVDAGDVQITQG
jgi:3-hydroxy acid dehydrogenase / malonic semialdehyde reductase